MATWTYTDDPENVPADAVRFLVGDTVSADPQPLSDAEVLFCLSRRNGVTTLAAMDAAGKLAAYYSRQADTTNGKTSVSASQRAIGFRALASDLKQQAASLNAPSNAFAGGLSLGQKQTLQSDTDAVPPTFSLGMDDEPGSNGRSIIPPC